ncbi:Hypothetical predicted protein [Scomber scombrus]|uniref:Uncharacterized protein n=1 Tax=Scomber scombrus TaxID=13677 RepID=A0AAV1PLP6_SCOSC
MPYNFPAATCNPAFEVQVVAIQRFMWIYPENVAPTGRAVFINSGLLSKM